MRAIQLLPVRRNLPPHRPLVGDQEFLPASQPPHHITPQLALISRHALVVRTPGEGRSENVPIMLGQRTWSSASIETTQETHAEHLVSPLHHKIRRVVIGQAEIVQLHRQHCSAGVGMCQQQVTAGNGVCLPVPSDNILPIVVGRHPDLGGL